ncbi:MULTISPECIES: DUF1361 domain-containing protein [unclassified Enterococcus]|uniref:DUF1361 domain-containing protein n=1 Tax=unclassified Enterococcus TaxID=2608891 RepID=UPI001555F51B|nr:MULTISPECIES: DUF1361 domain-containing protein [unclassified Enterococcus]MBS7578340.1 DUF1361 domain-containing protein [Enterococcus sp. MMGLQ5-2]MBS7585577.1 DUF1361 domain-containing protein [Enterococcus sp. MMGLQ5-1]NPD13436.1 DUF1361 domain-containing protein [Enterococcus sp. MMGLQ5-1]NPD38171.1 DUF1361 domain-containing protein [Enterococcus sp. MMGLQ5-2]
MNKKSVLLLHIYYISLLIIIHITFYQQSTYILLFVNTILALIPIELTLIGMQFKKLKFLIPLLIIWLLFLPNNFYLITDLFHISLLEPYDTTTALIKLDSEMWFKLMMIFLSVFPTIFLGCWSIQAVSQKICSHFNKQLKGIVLYPVILFLNTIGIYLGRFERWNSWEIFTQPFSLLKNIILIFKSSTGQQFILQFFIFSLVIMLSYHVILSILNYSPKSANHL